MTSSTRDKPATEAQAESKGTESMETESKAAEPEATKPPLVKSDSILLAIVDETPESNLAVRYVALRAQVWGVQVGLLGSVAPSPASGAIWASVDEALGQEDLARLEGQLATAGAQVQAITGRHPELFLRTGAMQTVLLELLAEESRISALILAAGVDSAGPLISALTGKVLTKMQIPVVILPNALNGWSDEALAALVK